MDCLLTLPGIAQRSGVASVLAGLDMTMPGDGDFFANGASFLGPQLTLAVLNGSIPLWRLDDMVLRITAAWYQMGQDSTSFPRPNFSSWFRSESGPVYVGSDEEGQKQSTVQNEYVDAREEHHELARQISAEGVVLLKNELGTLPLGRGKSARKQLVIIGSGAEVNPEGANACGDRSCNRGTLGWCYQLLNRDAADGG